VTFEVPHKPGYRLKMRMGIHSGSVVAGNLFIFLLKI
jgi:class 3 adenylate cyclase